MHTQKNIFIFLCAAFFFFTAYAAAQTQSGGNAFITLTPPSPSPNEEVTAEFRGFSFDINTSRITWTKNGSISLSGTGAKIFKFRTGAIGKKEILSATARTIDGKEITATAEFLLGDIDIVWKTNTTIPPEYKGKALPSPFSSITITAIPHFSSGGAVSSSGDLEFEWFFDGRKEGDASGIGKNIFQTNVGSSPVSRQITLKVKNTAKDISFEKNISIPVRSPEVFLYEERPLEGPHIGLALSQLTLRASESKTFRAVPYFFPKEDAPFLSYEWIQNTKEKNPSPSYLFELSTKEAGSQTINLEVTIKNTKHTIQQALAKLIINVR